MSDKSAYALLKTIRGNTDSVHTTMTRKQENDRWLSVQTSAIPIHTTQIDTPAPQQQQPPVEQYAPKPHNFGFYREIVAKHNQALKQLGRQ